MKTLRLILGDQLNYKHSWYRNDDQSIYYFIAEMRQETDYVVHHIQKVTAFFEAMREFSAWLKSRKKQIIYYQLQDKQNQQDLSKNIKNLIENYGFEKFEYQLPDEYRLDHQLKTLCTKLKIDFETYDTEHFLTKREDLTEFFKGKKSLLMESFYRHMRKKHKILIIGDETPEGGKWNYDQTNRKKWKKNIKIPHQYQFRKSVSATFNRIVKSGIKTLGKIDPEHFPWPINRKDSLKMLHHFCKYLLPHFGDYQDAMDPKEVYLFHSRLSFSLNSKMLNPLEVIEAVIGQWECNKEVIHINQVEGFIRQILGWREYMRGIYWREMPHYRKQNKLQNSKPLPAFYWDADTDMNCLHQTIKNSLQHAYAHHIQRLMITGNFALLTQTNPDQVEAWYLGIYIDAIEWVEMPNTRGMSQYADGGLVATKPYISSGAYINKMSNYCSECRYNVKERIGNDACPFNSLYWNFLLKKRSHFNKNPRMAMMLSLLNKLTFSEKKDIQNHADRFIKSLQID
ncbi:cryptochrome/photolyase family protein [Microbulbifer echini]|uniref:Cryptochrome/photolyase family protein n=1 Tax=Microbulbifer echini TaxID=1529067 RepID=A0ABV4NL34_9GAMM|nr:cryptochrome/photolyase family protein [uncultured Microbulbifer sp.]